MYYMWNVKHSEIEDTPCMLCVYLVYFIYYLYNDYLSVCMESLIFSSAKLEAVNYGLTLLHTQK